MRSIRNYVPDQQGYVEKSLWEKNPVASKAPENAPNGKSCQQFVFQKPWEAKHAIGKQHTKRIEFERREGIATVDFSQRYGLFGCFTIQGKPNAVDKLMKEIGEHLDSCQVMHAVELFGF